jgi:hypothetical protein
LPTDQRPTLSPPFDPEAFARESESKLRAGVRSRDVPFDPDGEPPTRRGPDPNSGTASEVRRVVRTPQAALSRTAVPLLTVSFAELRTMPLDHRAGFLISLIDGNSTVEMILDVSGMPEVEAMAILVSFAQTGIIALT